MLNIIIGLPVIYSEMKPITGLGLTCANYIIINGITWLRQRCIRERGNERTISNICIQDGVTKEDTTGGPDLAYTEFKF